MLVGEKQTKTKITKIIIIIIIITIIIMNIFIRIKHRYKKENSIIHNK